MRTILFLSLALIILLSCGEENKAIHDPSFNTAKTIGLDSALIKKLDSLVKEDQKWRTLDTRFHNNSIPEDSIGGDLIQMRMAMTDSANTAEVRRVLAKYGFPNYDIAGKEGSANFWLLAQHQDNYPQLQDSVLTRMKIEAEKGKASWANYAYLTDRVKMNYGVPQIYGTQLQVNEDRTSYEPIIVDDPQKLNERRNAVGLTSIEEYITLTNKQNRGKLK